VAGLASRPEQCPWQGACRGARRFGRLAGAAAQIIELCAADGAAAHDLDRLDVRAVQREDALDAFAEADLADGEVGAQTALERAMQTPS
jgi:hypothetical protein